MAASDSDDDYSQAFDDGQPPWLSDEEGEPEPEPEPTTPHPPLGAMALVLEQGSCWTATPSPAFVRSEVQAAQLRLMLCFLQQERLTEHCAAVPEGGEVFEIVAACFKVPSPASHSRTHHTLKHGAKTGCRIFDELFTRIASASFVRRQGTRCRWSRR